MNAPLKEPGRISRTLIRLMMKRARVAANEAIGDGYRLITLEGPELRGVDWLPGQKIQMAMGSAFVTRTYTPIDWDTDAGSTRILGYVHGMGPGSAWVAGVRPGDECDIFGPRSSLDLRRIDGPVALYGDETSIGLAHAAMHADASRRVACHFEVGDRVGSGMAAARLGIAAAATFHERRADDAQLAALEESLAAQAAAGARFVLTGKATTIQRLRQSLKRLGVASGRIAAKAYWAPGKVGLD
ncbi:siderophore-interacting protein [Pleomorphomonas oryzae]|uniref:siderophore-interacting protein n=1 Tax=Pleomorphomonas oryzae TaxID=261934 RepID=UPI00040E087D|nr:siderophore-interacting protein [Pleomorphomonas oryzae]